MNPLMTGVVEFAVAAVSVVAELSEKSDVSVPYIQIAYTEGERPAGIPAIRRAAPVSRRHGLLLTGPNPRTLSKRRVES